MCIQKQSTLVMVMYDQNLRVSSMNVILRFTICRNNEIIKGQICIFFVIFREKLVNFCIISHEISKITGIGCEQDFTI